MASDALGNLTHDVGKGIDEGTVAALISRLLDDPGDMDDAADVIRRTFVAPKVTPPRIEQHIPRDWASAECISYKVRSAKVLFVDILALNLRFSALLVLER